VTFKVSLNSRGALDKRHRWWRPITEWSLYASTDIPLVFKLICHLRFRARQASRFQFKVIAEFTSLGS
jgi:hypothetical protein